MKLLIETFKKLNLGIRRILVVILVLIPIITLTIGLEDYHTATILAIGIALFSILIEFIVLAILLWVYNGFTTNQEK